MNVKKYTNNTWREITPYKYGTSVETYTDLPQIIYANGNSASIDLKGALSQSGVPTPTTPIQPSGCGDLETTGVHAGQYKIPISSAGQTTPIYFGEVETTRKIRKLVLTGEEDWNFFRNTSGEYGAWQFYINNAVQALGSISALSNIAPYGVTASSREHYPYGSYIAGGGVSLCFQMAGAKDTFTDITAWKSYLAQQYAAGTPVTVWYVLATPTTGIVNEPLMRIGDYADEVYNVSIPVTTGGDTISVDTTVQPSEVTVNYKGWHPVAGVHERNNGAWT